MFEYVTKIQNNVIIFQNSDINFQNNIITFQNSIINFQNNAGQGPGREEGREGCTLWEGWPHLMRGGTGQGDLERGRGGRRGEREGRAAPCGGREGGMERGREGGRAAPCGRAGLTWWVEAPDRAILSGAGAESIIDLAGAIVAGAIDIGFVPNKQRRKSPSRHNHSQLSF